MKIGKISIFEVLTAKTFENIDGATLSVILNRKEVSYPSVSIVRALFRKMLDFVINYVYYYQYFY